MSEESHLVVIDLTATQLRVLYRVISPGVPVNSFKCREIPKTFTLSQPIFQDMPPNIQKLVSQNIEIVRNGIILQPIPFRHVLLRVLRSLDVPEAQNASKPAEQFPLVDIIVLVPPSLFDSVYVLQTSLGEVWTLENLFLGQPQTSQTPKMRSPTQVPDSSGAQMYKLNPSSSFRCKSLFVTHYGHALSTALYRAPQLPALGMFVDIGYDETTVVVMSGNVTMNTATRRSQCGGAVITGCLIKALRSRLKMDGANQESSFLAGVWPYVVAHARRLARRICSVAPRSLEQKHIDHLPNEYVTIKAQGTLSNDGPLVGDKTDPFVIRDGSVGEEFQGSDGLQFDLGYERLTCAEAILNPSIIGSPAAGVGHLILSSLAALPPSIAATILGHIYIIGAFAVIGGLEKRLTKDLTTSVPDFLAPCISVRVLDDSLLPEGVHSLGLRSTDGFEPVAAAVAAIMSYTDETWAANTTTAELYSQFPVLPRLRFWQ